MSIKPNHNVMLQQSNYRISAVPAFNDNYLWLIDNQEQAFVVDPGDAKPIQNALAELNLKLTGILVTHHHADHTGGVDELVRQYQVPVYGPRSVNIPQVSEPVEHHSAVSILGLNATVIAVPGHTLDHIAYFIDTPNPLEQPLLFCGDTLFAGGCGRVFEGTYAQMCDSLSLLLKLPEATRIFCAHEYTTANLAFAQAVEPENQALQQRVSEVAKLRRENMPTVPSTLREELETNPFLRFSQSAVINAAVKRDQLDTINNENVFESIRRWKDNF